MADKKPAAQPAATTEKKTPKTAEERLAALKAEQAKALERFEGREKTILHQQRFGGTSAITQQKIVLGAWLWKLSQEDPEVKKMALALISKMPEDDQVKFTRFLAVINEKK